MRKRFQVFFTICVLLIFFAGCASTGSHGNKTETDTNPCPDPTRHSARIKAEAVLTGALAGAAAGAALGQAAGKDTKSTVIGGVIGGLLGGAAGYSWGKTVAERKAQYETEECRLYGETQLIKKNNGELKEYNRKTANEIKTLDTEIANLKMQYRSGKALAYALKAKQDSIVKMYAENIEKKEGLTNELKALDNYLTSLKEAKTDAAVAELENTDVAKLETEIEALRANIAILDNNNTQMAKMAESLNIRK